MVIGSHDKLINYRIVWEFAYEFDMMKLAEFHHIRELKNLFQLSSVFYLSQILYRI